MKQKKKSGDYG